MEDIVLLPRVAHLVGEGDFHVLVGRIDLAATFIDGTEDRFDARSGLRHERCRSRGCDGEHGDVAAAYLRHLLVQGRVGFADAFYHRIALLLEVVVHREGAPFAGHLYRGAIGFHGQRLLYLHREGYRFVGAVSEPQCGEHVALGGMPSPVRRPLSAFSRIFSHRESSTRRMSRSSGSCFILL